LRGTQTKRNRPADLPAQGSPAHFRYTFVAMSLNWKLLAAVVAALSLQGQDPEAKPPRYYLVLLRPDPGRKVLSKGDSKRLQSAHMANIRQLANDGDLVAAGPCDDEPTTISGLFILPDVGTLREARQIAVHDPTVLKRRNTVEVYAWLGPPGIGDEYNKLHKADPDLPENMQLHPLALLYRGTAWAPNDRLLAAHEQYIQELKQQGKLGAAGPTETPDDLAGVVIFKAISMADAQVYLSKDPAVRARVLRIDWHRWLAADHVLPW
jgi:uncharacterized protein YciI